MKRYDTAFAWSAIQKMESNNCKQLFLTFKDQNSEQTLEKFFNQKFDLKRETETSNQLQSFVYLIDCTIKLDDFYLFLHAS